MYILRSSEILSTLSESIDPANIPKKYGGQLDWTFGDMPALDPGFTDLIEGELSLHPTFGEGDGAEARAGGGGKQSLPIGPIKWVRGEQGKMTAVAMGREKGRQREETLFALKADWEKVFYPKAEGGEAAGDVGAGQGGPEAARADGPGQAAVDGAAQGRGELPSNGVVGVVGAPSPARKHEVAAGRASVDSQTPSIPTAAGPPVQA